MWNGWICFRWRTWLINHVLWGGKEYLHINNFHALKNKADSIMMCKKYINHF